MPLHMKRKRLWRSLRPCSLYCPLLVQMFVNHLRLSAGQLKLLLTYLLRYSIPVVARYEEYESVSDADDFVDRCPPGTFSGVSGEFPTTIATARVGDYLPDDNETSGYRRSIGRAVIKGPERNDLLRFLLEQVRQEGIYYITILL